MIVHWTDTAQRHLAAIYSYIEQDSPEYALRMIDVVAVLHEARNVQPCSGEED